MKGSKGTLNIFKQSHITSYVRKLVKCGYLDLKEGEYDIATILQKLQYEIALKNIKTAINNGIIDENFKVKILEANNEDQTK